MAGDLEMGQPPDISNLGDNEERFMKSLSSKSLKVAVIEVADRFGNREEAEEKLKDWFMEKVHTSSAIHTAVRVGYPNLVVDNFVQLKANIDVLELVQSGTLLEASKAGYSKIASLIIEFVQNKEPEMLQKLINFRDPDGKTSLHWACQNMHTNVAKTILASNGHIPIDFDDGQNRKFTTPLHLSINPWVTEENPQRIIPKSERRTGVGLVRLLLRSAEGSEFLNLKDWQGNTPLHLAVETRNVDVVELLIRQPRLVATERNCEDKTPWRLVWDLDQSDRAKDDPDVKIIRKYLENLPDVQEENETFRDTKSRYYNWVSNLLVAAAVLAQVTFSGILSMVTLSPELLTEVCPADASAPSPAGPSAPSPSLSPISSSCPGTHSQNFMQLRAYYIRAIDVFRGSNNLSFFFSIVTIMAAIRLLTLRGLDLPPDNEISRLRHNTTLISLSLTFSTIFAVAAFISGGLGKVPVAESGWGYVLSQWTRGHSVAILKSTMLTTTMVGLLLIIPFILFPLGKDYFDIFRAHLETKIVSWDIHHARHAIGVRRPLLTLVLAILFLVVTLFIMFMLIFGIGLLKDYIQPPPS